MDAINIDDIIGKIVPKHKELFPFQVEGLKFLLSSPSPHLYLGDDMGVGKTIQAIAFSRAINVNKLLIICPASLRLNWKREIVEWLSVSQSKVAVISKSKDIEDFKLPKKDIIIVNYELISAQNLSVYKYISSIAWDLIVLDEAHFIRSYKSNRTKRITTLWKKAYKEHNTRVLCLSGTPMLNSALDLYPPLNCIIPHLNYIHETDKILCTSWFKFAYRFTNVHTNKFGTTYSGAKNHEHLSKILKQDGKFFIRRTKEQVLKQLPTITYNKFELDLNIKHVFTDTERNMLEHYSNTDTDNNDNEHTSILDMQKHFATVRKDLGLLKAKSKDIYEIIDLLVEQSNNNCLVVFFYHKCVKDVLYAELSKKYNVSIHDGDTSAKEKQNSVDNFQSGASNILLAQVDSATGYTVTRADNCLFIEYSWLPTQQEQAIARILRIGQESNCVTAHYAIANNELDKLLIKKLIAKQKHVEKII